MADTKYTYGLSPSVLAAIERKFQQKRAMGGIVEPWEVEAAYAGALDAASKNASSDYFRGKELDLREEDMALRRDALEGETKASTLGAVGNLGLTGMWAGKEFGLWGNGAKEGATKTPGLIDKGISTAKGWLSPGTAAPTSAADTATPWLTYESQLTPAVTPTATAVGSGTMAAETPAALEAAMMGPEAGGTVIPAATPMTAYLGPAAAGYMAPGILDTIHKDSTENLGHNLTGAGKLWGGENEARTAGGALSGAAAGAAVGSVIPGVGTVVGAGVGALAGAVGVNCIIVTLCTHQDSEEVNIAREYRDRFLSQEQLRGYYMVAEVICPWIIRNRFVKKMVKRILVDALIEYGRHVLQGGPYGIYAHAVTKAFLLLCRVIGSRKQVFVRANGETV